MEHNQPQTEQDLTQQAAVRRQKLADLRAAGQDPFVNTKYPQDAYSADLKAEFAGLPAEAETGKTVTLAGRMMSKRVMGKASFAHLREEPAAAAGEVPRPDRPGSPLPSALCGSDRQP